MEFVQEILNRRAMEAALADSLMPEEINEDWQLSQFWYSTETSISLANEALKNTSIACVSCPSIHTQLLNMDKPAILFEYDQRFKVSRGYKFYDFNEPLTFDPEFLNSFDLVIADPPFLSRECFEKTAITVNALKKKNGKVMVCTGTVQKNLVLDLVGAKITKFKPQHENGLSNDFSCFLNYESDDVKFFFQDDIEE